MLGMDRESNGWRAYALELWAESRERVADELCAGAECFARLGFVGEALKDRYVAGRLRNRAGTDRVEAAELWRRSEVTSYASKEVLLSPQCAGRRLRDAACAFPLHRWRACRRLRFAFRATWPPGGPHLPLSRAELGPPSFCGL